MKSHIVVNLDLPSEDRLKIVLSALEPETKTSTSTRSRVKVQAKGNTLRLNIEATDTSALRAAVNSYLRWIGVIINMCSALDLLSRE